MATTCFPPTRLQSSTRISRADAEKLIQDYLECSRADASLHPDAILTESEPLAPSLGSETQGIILHNLAKVHAGLQGKVLAPDDLHDLAEGEDNTYDSLHQPLSFGNDIAISNSPLEHNGSGRERAVVEGMEWQDLEDFEREQEDVLGAENGTVVPEPGAVEGAVTVTAASEVRPLGDEAAAAVANNKVPEIDDTRGNRERKKAKKRERKDASK